ncbi:BglG family transcription antiterminator [Caviibacter abscessus]|uniref:BglG family transcription antiterminator n=1 Tax=Caviibacter abscessus TaxID=1766719 RepID=UPI00082AD2CA|nr:PTS sugar transporter subunit IIA [Caviibacter abscessus]
MVNKRQIEILDMLILNKSLSMEHLSKYFKVSIRSIQYSINIINYYLSQNSFEIIKIKSGNIFLTNESEIIKIINLLKEEKSLKREERLLILQIYSSFSEKGLNISKLSKMINVSRNTLKSDMASIKEYKFNYSKSNGYYLNVSNDFRLNKLIEVYENDHLLKYIQNIIDDKLFLNIEKFIKEIAKNIILNLNEESYKKLKILIYCQIKYPEKMENVFHDNLIIEEIKKVYLKYFNNLNGFNRILDFIVGNSLYLNVNSGLDESFFIKQMIKFVSEKVNVNLNEDKILNNFLLSHLKVSIYRLKENIELKNQIYENLIWNKDPIIFIIKKAVCDIEVAFDIKFTDTEILLIAYHFKASINRMSVCNRKKVILVCGLGYGTSRVLEYNLKEKFDVDIVDIMPAYMVNIKTINKHNIDYILTTVNLEIENSIKINPVLNYEDYKKLEELGISRKKDKILISEFLDDLSTINNFNNDKVAQMLLNKYSKFFFEKYNLSSELLNILTKEKCIFKDNVKTLEEAVNILGNNLEKLGVTNKNYTDEMLKALEKFGTYIVISENVAIPHAKNTNGVNKTDVSILIIKDPIKVKDKNINFMLCFSSIGNSSHLGIINDVYKLIMIKDFSKKISNIRNYKQLIEYFKEVFK